MTVSASPCILIAWIAISLSVAAAQQPTSRPTSETRDDIGGAQSLSQISVEILGPIATLKGHGWTRGFDLATDKQDQLLRQILVNQPHHVVIRLPSGRIIRYVSKATFFNQEHGIVTRAALMPHLGDPMRYQDAISLLELVLRQWDAEPTESTKRELEKWKKEGDVAADYLSSRSGGAMLHGEDKVGISFAMRSTFSSNGWIPTIDVAATFEQEQLLWGSPAQQTSTTQPTAKP